ncbi:hypothetical protein [Nitrosomonas sp. ANs5]|uniref:hypothetical protein n=1 Tax=Nitrosomonas sp. ANs5 TaxID=3423941 RepID=UPI003D3599E0
MPSVSPAVSIALLALARIGIALVLVAWRTIFTGIAPARIILRVTLISGAAFVQKAEMTHLRVPDREQCASSQATAETVPALVTG